MAYSKRYLEAKKMVEENKTYPLAEAVDLLKSMPKLKFDEMVEISGKLGADPKQSDQMVRGSVVLPHGTGNQTKVLVFCEPEKEKDAKPNYPVKYGFDLNVNLSPTLKLNLTTNTDFARLSSLLLCRRINDSRL